MEMAAVLSRIEITEVGYPYNLRNDVSGVRLAQALL